VPPVDPDLALRQAAVTRAREAAVYAVKQANAIAAYSVENPLHASITINFKQSYEYLRNRFTMNTLWFKADIDSEVEKLKKDGAIVIKDVDYLGGDAAAGQFGEHVSIVIRNPVIK